jgi:hypothetical protein
VIRGSGPESQKPDGAALGRLSGFAMYHYRLWAAASRSSHMATTADLSSAV